MQQRTTVLVTGAGSVPAQCALRALKRQSEFAVVTLAADMNPLNAGRYEADEFVQVPRADDPDFVSTLLSIVAARSVDLLIPVIDDEFLPLAAAAAEFASLGCRLTLCEPEALRICLDKYETTQFLERHGIGAPRSWLPSALPDDLSYPLFIKPRHMGRGSVDAYWVDSEAELAFHLRRVNDAVVQQALRGRFLAVDVLCGLDGGVLGALSRRLDEFKAGVVTRGETVDAPEAIAACVHAAAALDARGPMHFQLFETETGPRIIEINPRFPAGLSHAVAAGFDMPLCLLRLLHGRDPGCQIGGYPSGVHLVRHFQDFFVDGSGRLLQAGALTCDGSKPVAAKESHVRVSEPCDSSDERRVAEDNAQTTGRPPLKWQSPGSRNGGHPGTENDVPTPRSVASRSDANSLGAPAPESSQ